MGGTTYANTPDTPAVVPTPAATKMDSTDRHAILLGEAMKLVQRIEKTPVGQVPDAQLEKAIGILDEVLAIIPNPTGEEN